MEHLVEVQIEIEQIDLVSYETDLELIPFSEKALDYLKEWLLNKGIQFKYVLHYSDFVLENASVLKENSLPSLFKETKSVDKNFDIIISNPPYFKLSKDVSVRPSTYFLIKKVFLALGQKNETSLHRKGETEIHRGL